MNIDEIVYRLRKPNKQDYLDYLMALNPTLIHFFNFFAQNPKKTQEWFRELSENFYNKIQGRDSTPKQCKKLILNGAVNLIRRNNQDDLLYRCNELIYEEVLLQPLPQRIFSVSYIPNHEDLKRFRTQQLSTPMCLILDLIFQEKLQIQETSKILRLSENVFEPFLFTVVHRLMGETPIENKNDENELEFFSRILHSGENESTDIKFAQQLTCLKSFLSLDIRSRLDQADLLNLCEKHFPSLAKEVEQNTTTLNSTSKSVSLIDQIKQRNQELKLEEAARQFIKPDSHSEAEIEAYNPTPVINTNVFNYAKYAFGILTLFITLVFYRTIFEKKEIPKIIANNGLQATSLKALQAKLDRVIGTLTTMDDEVSISQMQWIMQQKQPALLTIKPNIDIQIAENTKLQLRSNTELFLKYGSLKITTKNSEFKIFSNEGIVIIDGRNNKNSSAHVAKPRPNYSIAGNLSGKVGVETEFFEQKIELNIGQQIIFGDSQLNKTSSYNSAYFQTRSNTPQFNRRKFQVHLPQTRSNSLSGNELKDVLLSVEKVKKKPTVQQKDFLQKL